MDAALMGATIIACCFAAGVFETGKRKKDRNDSNANDHGGREDADDRNA